MSDNHYHSKPTVPDNFDPNAAGAPKQQSSTEPAVDLIRHKIDALYQQSPNVSEELAEIAAANPRIPSKHQAFMEKLSTSGKSLAEIQTEWHNYYTSLSDQEKHEVWQEFYANHQAQHAQPRQGQRANTVSQSSLERTAPGTHVGEIWSHNTQKSHRHRKKRSTRSVAEIKRQIVHKVGAQGKLKTKHHLQSLLFGFGLGSIVLLILLFGFFNERFIAPFITPSRTVSNTPIIIDPNSTAVDPEPKIVIPKINVEIPVVYDVKSIEEKDIQKGLERGVVHYASTPSPGEKGNGVIFGHSSNNIFNKGQYKFAFVLLSRLNAGDTFMLTKDGTRYVYRVYDKRIVKPTDLSVLGSTAKPATVTLITCDPPGTSINRLVVIGEQISPDPAANVESTAVKSTGQPKIVPSNAPSLWQRIIDWLRP